MKLFVFVCLALLGAAFAQTLNVHSLIEQAQKLTIKANQFISFEKEKGNLKYLQVLERDVSAVQTIIVDLMKHEQGQLKSEDELKLIEESLQGYEIRIEKDIEAAKIAIGITDAPTTEITTPPHTDTDAPTTEAPTTESQITTEQTTEPTIHDHTIPETTTVGGIFTVTIPDDNLVLTAEALLSKAREILYNHQGEHITQLENQIKVVNDLLVLAKDPLNKTDKFMLAVILGNQVKSLRELIDKVQPQPH